MSHRGCILLCGSNGWQLAVANPGEPAFHPVDIHSDPSPDALATQVEAFVLQQKLRSKKLLIALDAQSALVGNFEIPQGAKRNRRTLAYQLESTLPFAAEDLVADYLCHGHQILGVALEIDRWLPLIVAMEMRGIRLQSILPGAILAAQSLGDESPAKEQDVIVWQDGQNIELFGLDQQHINLWMHLDATPQAVVARLAVGALHQRGALRALLVNVSPDITSAVRALEDISCTSLETEPLARHAVKSAVAILEGQRAPLVELRRDELSLGDPFRTVRGSLTLLMAAAALFLLAWIGVFWSQASQYRQRTDQAREEQIELYRAAFPGSRVPSGILSRLRSEHSKLAGARGRVDDVGPPEAALGVLHDFLVALPRDLRFRIRELRIENGELDMDVDLRAHSDANQLVGALRKAGFAIEPPSTVQRGGNSVSSRLHGTREVADVQSELRNPSP